MNKWPAFLVLLVSLSVQCVLAVSATIADDRPNIVFILVDDQRNDTLGCAGHDIVKTPVIDSLADRGVRFRNAFVTTSICAASRASILTGTMERTHGFTFGKPPISKAHMNASYPGLLKAAGYRTGFVGKYGVRHEGNAQKEVFDVFRSLPVNRYMIKQKDGSIRHETDICADVAVQFIEESKEDQPFCMSISFNAVHAKDGDTENHYPWPASADGMYKDVDIPSPRLGDPKIFESQPDVLKDSMNRDRFFWRWDMPEKYDRNMRAYFRMISGVDHAIGRVLKALEEKGIAGNTIVIYTADNGYYMGDRGFAGKWSHYEQSLRVPLIVVDPRMPKEQRGMVMDAMALNIDLPATMLDAADIAIPQHYEGQSLMPLVHQGAKPNDWRNSFHCEHLMNHKRIPKWRGVRGVRYVYAHYFEHDYEFLHDLEKDPDQLKNFASDPEYANILAHMRERCGVEK